jgi:hypothetical protein
MYVSDLLTNGKLSRHYSPETFMAVMDDHGAAGQSVVRRALRRLDSGRFEAMLEATHKHLSYSDIAGLEAAKSMLSHETLRWVNVYGRAQDLRTFEVPETAADGGRDITPNYGRLGGL